MITISTSGTFRAVLKDLVRNGVSKQYIEIWDSTTKLDCLDLDNAGMHGQVYKKGTFFSFQWGNVENKLLYIAEKKAAKKESYFTRKFALDTERGTEYQFEESFGEQLEGSSSPIICILNINNMTITTVQEFPEGCTPAQAIWAPDDSGTLLSFFGNLCIGSVAFIGELQGIVSKSAVG